MNTVVSRNTGHENHSTNRQGVSVCTTMCPLYPGYLDTKAEPLDWRSPEATTQRMDPRIVRQPVTDDTTYSDA